uniref:NHL repeat-containing protein n=1 Tax=Leersia perrieri TaxID=77586 RepID=A0A0D9X7T5_9ORYZ
MIMASPPRRLPHALLLIIAAVPILAAASANLILEDGYTVTTFADLNHQNPTSPNSPQPHPYALLPRPRAGDLVLLDSAASALYTLSAAAAAPRSLAGGGRGTGFADGGPTDAAFDRPRSVAVDDADNVYVADRINGAVRKIAPSGFTTTIAGGRSKGPGHKDGPAQNASFSADFELVYVPKMCALLVTDRGNRLIRQINLKREDCAHETQPGLGTTSVSIIVVLCTLLGSVIGFFVRHFYPAHEVSINRFFRRMQIQYKRIQRRAALISFSDIKSVVANSMFHALLLKLVRVSLGYLSVLFPSVRFDRRVPVKPCPSLIDLDYPVITSTGPNIKADASTELVGDFIGFDGDTSSEDKEPADELAALLVLDSPELSSKKAQIDDMFEANLSEFSGQENYHSSAGNVLV